MPWLIQHKCNPADPDLSNYAIMRGGTTDMPLTKITCPSCREEFFILGHEMFQEAHTAEEQSRLTMAAGLPPGFVIARTRPRE